MGFVIRRHRYPKWSERLSRINEERAQRESRGGDGGRRGGQTRVNILSGGINMQRRKAEEINEEEAAKEEYKKTAEKVNRRQP